jgi:hypothetical protein
MNLKTAVILIAGIVSSVLIVSFILYDPSHAAQPQLSDSVVFQPAGGYFANDTLVSIIGSKQAPKIIYTTNGSEPTPENGVVYDDAIQLRIASPGVYPLRARVIASDGTLGPITTASYAVGLDSSLPILSLVTDPTNLWSPESGLYANYNMRGLDWERPVDVFYLETSANGEQYAAGFEIPAGLRIHGSTTRGYDKKSLRLYFRDEYGQNRLEYPLFATLGAPFSAESTPNPNSLASLKRLILHDGGQDFPAPDFGANWTLLRGPVTYALAEEMGQYTTDAQPTILFLNGEMQGIYQIRNRIDDWFLADKYGFENVDYLDEPHRKIYGDLDLTTPDTLPALSQLTPEQQAGVRWEEILRYVNSHDMSTPESYAWLEERIDIENLIDYTVLQFYIANTDWLRNNVKQFRPRTAGGRWKWIFWDVDYGYGLSPWGNYDTNMIEWLYSAEWPEFERGAPLLKGLLTNELFVTAFLERTDELLNTTLAPENVQHKIDILAAELRPDINYESGRWGSPGDWEHSVAEMKEFAANRPNTLRSELEQWYGLQSLP